MALNLEKGQKISLSKEAGGTLTKVTMGLGWDVAKKGGMLGGLFGSSGGSVDLDASCVMFDDSNKIIDTVWFRQLKSKDGRTTRTDKNCKVYRRHRKGTAVGNGRDRVVSRHCFR